MKLSFFKMNVDIQGKSPTWVQPSKVTSSVTRETTLQLGLEIA
jgi:hypothetical protein